MLRRIFLSLIVVFIHFYTSAQLNIYANIDKARKEISEGKNEEAIQRLNRLIKQKPDLYEAYFFRGIAKFYLNDYTGAVQDYSMVISLNPFLPDAFQYRGIAKQSLQDYNSALLDFERAAQMEKTNPGIYINRGLTKLSLKNFSSALEDFEKALKLNPDLYEVYLYKSAAKAGLKQYESAIYDCNTALSINQFSDEAYMRRGLIQYEQENFQEAIKDFNSAIKINPKSAYTYYARAITKIRLNDLKGSIDDYHKVIEIDPYNALAYYNIAMLYIQLDEKKDAILYLDKVIALNPDHLLSYYNRGILKTDLKMFKSAIEDFDQAILLYPDFAEAYYMRSVNKLKLNLSRSAKNDYTVAMAKFNAQDKDSNLVIENSKKYSKIIELDADFNSTFAGSGEIFNVYSGIEPINDYFLIISKNKVINEAFLPQELNLLKRVQSYFISISDRSDTTIHFAELNIAIDSLQLLQSSFEYFLFKGLIAANLKDFNSALLALDQAAKVKADFAWIYMARAHVRLQMYAFIQSVDPLVNVDFGLSSPDIENKQDQESKIDYTLVFDDYNKAIDLNPDNAYAYFNRANLKVIAGHLDGALFDFERAIKLEPEFADAYFNLGLLLIHMKEFSKACLALSKSGELGQEKAWLVIKRYCKK